MPNIQRTPSWNREKCFITLLIFSLLFVGTHAFAQSSADDDYQKAINYEKGENGVEKNQEKSIKWLIKAAEAGSTDALAEAGGKYLAGRDGFIKDEKKGCEWTEKAAEAGSVYAQVNLFKGYNLKICGNFWNRREKAHYWHKEVVENDKDGWFLHQLVNFYLLSNQQFRIEEEELRELALLAAQRGDASSQFDLAAMYHPLPFYTFGLFKADRIKAISWFKQSARQGYGSAITTLKNVYGITNLDDSGPGATPESISCPQEGLVLLPGDNLAQGMTIYDNRETVIYGEAECLYEDDIKIQFGWTEYPDPLDGEKHCKRVVSSASFGNNDVADIEFRKFTDKTPQYLSVSSYKSLASISVYLPKREFEKEFNRPQGSQKWVSLALKLLPESESRGKSCVDTAGVKKTTQKSLPVVEKKKKADPPHKKTAPKPSAWDSWDAPSPKAKTPN